VLLLVMAYFLVFQPKQNQIKASEIQVEYQQQQLAQLQQVASQKPLYLALTKQIQSRLKGVELTADPRGYVPTYLKQIEALAKRDGLAVLSVAPQPTPAPSPSASPGATPNPSSVQNAPIIGAPIRAAARVAGGFSTSTCLPASSTFLASGASKSCGTAI